MFSWFSGKPRCPIEPSVQQWIDQEFLGCIETLGLQRLLNSKFILPDNDFFPRRFAATPEGVQTLLDQLCSWMGMDPKQILLSYYDALAPPSELTQVPPTSTANGEIEIWLEIDAIDDPPRLAACLTRELGHACLVSIDPDLAEDADHEYRAELVAVFLGAGLFLANTGLLMENWSDGQMSGTIMANRSYMDMQMFGYAMALYAALRGEWQPNWSRHLRPDVRGALRQSLDYLQAVSDHPVLKPQ